MDEARVSPRIAVLTNLRLDHLNRYPDKEAYWGAKEAVVKYQTSSDWAILPAVGHERSRWEGLGGARRAFFAGENSDVSSWGDEYLVWIESGTIKVRWDSAENDLAPLSDLPEHSRHHVENAMAAICAARAAGVPPASIAARLPTLSAVPHRMQHVMTIDGVDYVDNTAATAIFAAAASLSAFEGRQIILIGGGAWKGLPPEPLAEAAAAHGAAVVLLPGTATEGLEDAFRDHRIRDIRGPVASMAEAVGEARKLAQPGAVVLLSPGEASCGSSPYDLFTDEFDRGRQFQECLRQLRAG
jgi:UDP-N-acetylmuramoylalanine--D-glutamate ligase